MHLQCLSNNLSLGTGLLWDAGKEKPHFVCLVTCQVLLPTLHYTMLDITCANYVLYKMQQTDAIITGCRWTVSFHQLWSHYLIYSLAKALFSALV